ncbi:MAG: PQQ-binding-like beta-propeller repeat protein [Acidobacteriota bacterium]|nr:PQQ-binding-like beta-propeller repeat protein [Acidobacteriota bacterium]
MKPRQTQKSFTGRRLPSSLLLWAAATVFLWTAGCGIHPSLGWPGWGGPGGDFKVKAVGLSTSWPSEGPPQLWSQEVGDGYAGILADGERLYTLYRQEEDEVVVALEPASGRTLWQHRYPAPILRELDSTHRKYGVGPQATPLLTREGLVTIGWNGTLHCLKKDTGEVVWSYELAGDFRSTPLSRGFSSSAIAYLEMVLWLVGGGGLGVLAFNASDGRVVWTRHDFKRSHSSPILINVDGQDQLVGMMEEEVVGVDPETGELLWSHTHGLAGGLTVSTPVWGEDNRLFLSTAYKGGSRALKLSRRKGKTSVEELWFTKRMRVHHGNVVRLDGMAYGFSGDFGPAFLSAIRVSDGEVVWRHRGFAKGTLLYADRKFIILDEDGTLALAVPGEKGIEVLAQAQPLEYNCWTVPSLVGDTLYVRSRKKIVAFDLGAE